MMADKWAVDNFKHKCRVHQITGLKYNIDFEVLVHTFNFSFSIFFDISLDSVDRKDQMGDFITVIVEMNKNIIYQWNEMMQDAGSDKKSLELSFDKMLNRVNDFMFNI